MTNHLLLTLTTDEVEQLQMSMQMIQLILERTQTTDSSFLTEKPAIILSNLHQALEETRMGYYDAHQRQFAFARFKHIVNEQLWTVYEGQPYYHRRLAVLLRTAVRRLTALELEKPHLDALESLLEKLGQSSLLHQDIITSQQQLRTCGIETLISFGEHRESLLDLYAQTDEA